LMERRLIIGVVGRTGGADESLAILALEVGLQITERDVILLTGGEPTAQAKAVKDAAMNGAVSHGSKKGRVISILPKTGNAAAPIRTIRNSTQLRIETLLGSHERNVINGRTADVMIAMQGGPGTLSEIAFANDVQTPVVFLNSLPQLRHEFDSKEQELIKIINDARKKYSWIDSEATVRQLSDLFSRPPDQLNLAVDAKTAVDKALTLAINSSNEPIYRGRFPASEPNTISQEEFDKKVAQL
jgi:uncharacterized protein (TIGR00725 family)